MLTIILNWIYILFTCFCMGFVFSMFVEKALHYPMKGMNSILMAGVVIAGIYAQIFSLLAGVGGAANLVMMTACAVACIVWRHRMAVFLKDFWENSTLACRILLPLLFLAWSYFTSRGYMVPDMNLYHGQSIRWIEEYGVIKGLGNLHMRFGYNSSVFALSALYSMKFLLGRSLHGVNGLLAFLLSTEALELRKCFRRRKMLLSDYARVGAVYYLSTIWDEVIAPSSDYAVMCTLFFIVVKWLAQLEEEDGERRDNVAPYALLCVGAVFALTLKVTAGLILVLTVKPACRLLAEKRWKEIGIYLFLGLLTAAPWMARTVLITGWLLYPSAAIDLFQVDWKVPEEVLKGDAYCIRTWGRGSNLLADGDRLQVWFPNWFRNELLSTEKLLVLADMASCAVAAGLAAEAVIRRKREKLDVLLVLGAMAACYLFWQFNAPMPRYGYAYILLLAALTAGYIVEEAPVLKKIKAARICYAALLVYGIYKLSVCGGYIAGSCRLENYVWQETYLEGGRERYDMDGVTFYYSSVGQPSGYDPFPAAPEPPAFHFELRGKELKEGLRYK